MKSLIVGNGVNIQYGGIENNNTGIVLRTLKNFEEPDFPKHILLNDPIDGKSYIGYLFFEVNKMLAGKYDSYTQSTTERIALNDFVKRYNCRKSLKITDIGFEDYYLIHDLLCHKLKIDNSEKYHVSEALKCFFLNSIYNHGKVNEIYHNFPEAFVLMLRTFGQIFTTNYDSNIEQATGKEVFHLHGGFSCRSSIYSPDSFRNHLSDKPYEHCMIDENFPYLYSTALTTYSGDYKQYSMTEAINANAAVEKFAIAYQDNPEVRESVDSWENDRNNLVARLRESVLLKIDNPDLKFQEHYPIRQLREIYGSLVILGLSPSNDYHLFQIINESNVKNCTYYYLDKSECELISDSLPNKDLEFSNVLALWGNMK